MFEATLWSPVAADVEGVFFGLEAAGCKVSQPDRQKESNRINGSKALSLAHALQNAMALVSIILALFVPFITVRNPFDVFVTRARCQEHWAGQRDGGPFIASREFHRGSGDIFGDRQD